MVEKFKNLLAYLLFYSLFNSNNYFFLLDRIPEQKNKEITTKVPRTHQIQRREGRQALFCKFLNFSTLTMTGTNSHSNSYKIKDSPPNPTAWVENLSDTGRTTFRAELRISQLGVLPLTTSSDWSMFPMLWLVNVVVELHGRGEPGSSPKKHGGRGRTWTKFSKSECTAASLQ